jgi:hypothetical protein
MNDAASVPFLSSPEKSHSVSVTKATGGTTGDTTVKEEERNTKDHEVSKDDVSTINR